MNGSFDQRRVSSSRIVQEMSYGHHRVIPYHPWTAPAHDCLHALPHLSIVAVDRAASARRLGLTMRTPVKAHIGISLQLCTVIAETIAPMMMAAIKLYHSRNGEFLAHDAVRLCRRKFHDAKLIKFHTPFIWKITSFKVNSLLKSNAYESSDRAISESPAA